MDDFGFGQPLVAVRVKDGIFVGNVTAAHDEDFLVMNKVTHIVNCAGAEIKDLFEEIGIEYLTFPWRDATGSTCTTTMFDPADRNIEQVVRFVDQGLEGGNCVLIHSYFGASRSCALLAAYLMVKYGWKLDNTLQFMSLAHQDMNIKPHFLRQLRAFAKRHEVNVDVFSKCVDINRFALDNDQWMLRNTYLNGLTAEVQNRNDLFKEAVTDVVINEPNFKSTAKRRRRLVFCDTKQGTGVSSNVTQPLAPRMQHSDPNTALHPRPSVLARRGQPNTHRLESPTDCNPRGRQVLLMKTREEEICERYTPVPERVEPTPRPQPKQASAPPPPSVPASVPPTKSSIRSPFALSYSAGAPRNGSPLPQQRTTRQREPTAPSSYAALQSQLRETPRGQRQVGSRDSPRPVQRTSSPIKRPVRTDSPKPKDRAGSPQVHRSNGSTIPNAQSTIVANNTLRGTSSIRPYSSAGTGSSSAAPQTSTRAGSPMSRPRTSSPMSRPRTDAQPQRGSPMRASSPMTRDRQAATLADQYLSGGGGVPRPRETTASMLRRQQNLAAHR